MQLAESPDPASAFAVDGYHGLETDLEIPSDPDHTGVDRSRRGVGIAKIICDRRRETCFDDRDQMIEEIRKLKIDDFRFQIRQAVLQRRAVDRLLGNERILGKIK